MHRSHARAQLLVCALAGTALVAAGFGMSAARERPTKSTTARGALVQDEDEDDEEGGKEEAIDPTKLPMPIQETAKKTFGKLDGLKASREEEGGGVLFEVEGKVDGREVSIRCVENGSIYELERGVTAAELPRGASENLQKEMPGAKLVKANAVEIHYFEATVEVDGKRREVAIGVSGRVHAGEGDEEEEEHEEHEGHEGGGR